MKNCTFIGSLFLLALLVTGCSNENFTSEISNDYDATYKNGPASLKINANAVGGPLFDLEMAPNGDILVANASKGITDFYGNLEVALPGVNSISTIGRGNMWATTGPPEESLFDNQQRLYLITYNRVQLVVNLYEFEAQNNPDGADINSNPFDVKALNGNSALVIDAGGNDLLRVDNKGNI